MNRLKTAGVIMFFLFTGCFVPLLNACAAGATYITHLSLEQVAQMVSDLKKCADSNSNSLHMNQCYCKSDIKISKLPVPDEIEEHCLKVAKENISISKLSNKEQEENMLISGAKDVQISSGVFFSMALPCLIKAIKKKDRNQVLGCFGFVQNVANQVMPHTYKNTKELADALGKAAQLAISSSKQG